VRQRVPGLQSVRGWKPDFYMARYAEAEIAAVNMR